MMHRLAWVLFFLLACGLSAVDITIYLNDQDTVHGILVSISASTVTIMTNNQKSRTYTSQEAEGFMLQGSENKYLFPIDQENPPDEIKLYVHDAPTVQYPSNRHRIRQTAIMPKLYLEISAGLATGLQTSEVDDYFEENEGELNDTFADFFFGIQLGYLDYVKLEYQVAWRGTSIEYDNPHSSYSFYRGMTTSSNRVNLKLAPWYISGDHKLNRFKVYILGSIGKADDFLDKYNSGYYNGILTSFGVELSRYGIMNNDGLTSDISITLEREQSQYDNIHIHGDIDYSSTSTITTYRLGFRVGACFKFIN